MTKDQGNESHPSAKDIVAVVIAALQTTLLPFLVVIAVLLVIAYVVARFYL